MSDTEEQYNPKAHKGLLSAISSLGKTQHIRKSTRSEPKPQLSEFELAKSSTRGAAATATLRRSVASVGVGDLVQVLQGTKKHKDTGKALKNVATNKKVLPKPLEKPVRERLKRTIGYEKVKKNLRRWDAVVAKNRSSEQQVFPLPGETIYVDTSSHAKPLQTSLQSDLMREMEATEEKLKAMKRELAGDTQDEHELQKREKLLLQRKLTRDELIARRRELAYLKMRESQKSAKARMRNKIKSKKYHKLMKRQKLQEEMKNFETLRQNDPEAAMEKLNALERSRVLERASLRHKNTGSWAKNLQVRAKYDRDVRKDLAEQLAMSRELTEKKDDSDDSDGNHEEVDELNDASDTERDPFNPWTRLDAAAKRETPHGEEGNENWRKYWLERNQNEKLLQSYRNELKEQQEEQKQEDGEHVNENEINLEENAVPAKAKKIKQSKKKAKIESGWLVEPLNDAITKNAADIDDIFDKQEDKVKQKLGKKAKALAKRSKNLKKLEAKLKKRRSTPKQEKDELKHLKDLEFKNDLKRPMIDEELNHDEQQTNHNLTKITTATTSSNQAGSNQAGSNDHQTTLPALIDPTNIAVVKLRQKFNGMSAINDCIDDIDIGDMEANQLADQQMTISQAFEDDDIVADFTQDKEKDTTVKDVELQLSMPGWGSWAGAGISQEQIEQRRNKRLVLKLAKEEKRRDENKDSLYINEHTNKDMRTHLVSDVPFPFTSVQDYEASIRQPIGRNFVTETAFRMLTRPAVIIRKGAVIEPMDESELVKPDRRLNNVVDRRIKQAQKLAEQRITNETHKRGKLVKRKM